MSVNKPNGNVITTSTVNTNNNVQSPTITMTTTTTPTTPLLEKIPQLDPLPVTIKKEIVENTYKPVIDINDYSMDDILNDLSPINSSDGGVCYIY